MSSHKASQQKNIKVNDLDLAELFDTIDDADLTKIVGGGNYPSKFSQFYGQNPTNQGRSYPFVNF